MTEVFDPNDVFTPVCEWSTVRMLFTLGVMRKWKTASIDFKNAFTQGQLPKPIYLELPSGFKQSNPGSDETVIKVTTSLYGDRCAANIWYRAIRKAFEDIGFVVSEFDPCLFIKDDCMICLYVDDAVVHAKDDETIERVLKQIDETGYKFSRDEAFDSYLGIQVEHRDDGSVKLSQPGLTHQFLDMMGMSDCNPSPTPSSGQLHSYRDAEDHDDSFNFRSALGMLMYLGNNTRPECAYAINVAAQYSIAPKKPHADAIRRIARYLKGTAEEGLIIKPDDDAPITLNCHVDADYAGNWNIADADDPDAVRSRAGGQRCQHFQAWCLR